MRVATRDESATVAELRHRARQLCGEWRESGRYQPSNDCWVRGFDPDFSRELGRRGLIGASWPREFGGHGLDGRARLAITEELLRAGAPVAAHWVGERQIGPTLMQRGSERLRRSVLPAIVAGEAVCSLGMSEPDAGSDLASLRTSARRTEHGYVLNGRKIWTSFAHRATHLYVLARTHTGAAKHEGITEFLIETTTPGISTAPIVDMAGEHHFNEVLLEDVEVAEDTVLGRPGEGWGQVVGHLAIERGGPERVLSTYPLLSALLARKVAKELNAELGRLAAEFAILRQMYWDVAAQIAAGEAPVSGASVLKWLGNRFELEVIELARAAGLDRDLETHELYQQALTAAPGFAVRGGSGPVLLGIIAKAEARRG